MAVIDIGSAATNRDSATSPGYTWIDAANAANDTGTLDTFELYLNGAGTVKVGTFSYSSPNATNRDVESLGSVSSNSKQTFTGKNCDVSSGDIIGFYSSAGALDLDSSGGVALYYKSGDIFGAGAQSMNTLSGYRMSLYATGATGGGATVKPHYYYLQQ